VAEADRLACKRCRTGIRRAG